MLYFENISSSSHIAVVTFRVTEAFIEVKEYNEMLCSQIGFFEIALYSYRNRVVEVPRYTRDTCIYIIFLFV